MAKGDSLADQLINAETVGLLVGRFGAIGAFDPAPCVARIMADLPNHALKSRISLIATVLADYLPSDFDAAAGIIHAALPPPLDPGLTDNDFGHFVYGALGVYTENQGLAGHFSTSLDLLCAITQRSTMEFSLRAFLNAYPVETLARLHDWAHHDNYHVRRLVSEGTRPRLPWGQNIGLTHADTLPLLDILHADTTRFVVRSVANHLNDITKTDPDAALFRLENWRDTARQNPKELNWLTRHALRGLVKSGHAGAMAHLGFPRDITTHATLLVAPNAVAIGETARLTATITPKADADLVVDYVIDFIKSNGKVSPKVFKLKTLRAKAHVPVTLTKRHMFRADATTFTHYPGPHQGHLQVNGQIVASAAFTLS